MLIVVHIVGKSSVVAFQKRQTPVRSAGCQGSYSYVLEALPASSRGGHWGFKGSGGEGIVKEKMRSKISGGKEHMGDCKLLCTVLMYDCASASFSDILESWMIISIKIRLVTVLINLTRASSNSGGNLRDKVRRPELHFDP